MKVCPTLPLNPFWKITSCQFDNLTTKFWFDWQPCCDLAAAVDDVVDDANRIAELGEVEEVGDVQGAAAAAEMIRFLSCSYDL